MNFDDLIRKVRVDISLSPWPYGAKNIEGFPYKLPLVVRSDGYIPAINSENRGAILEQGGRVYKLKGVDPHGNIPKTIRDRKRKKPKTLAENYPFHRAGLEGVIIPSEFKYSPLFEEVDYNSKIECGGYYLNEPFGVIRQTKAKNELLVCEKISDYLENFGFYTPYLPLYQGEFSNLFFENEETACIVLEIPSLGSDLRLNEFRRITLYNRSDPGKIFEISKKIAQWNGFSTKIHKDLDLSPTETSLGWDNYVLARVSREGIGLVKNDLGSTKVDLPPGESILKKMRIDGGYLVSGRRKNQTLREWKRDFREIEGCFARGLREVPEPIPEIEIMALFEGF